MDQKENGCNQCWDLLAAYLDQYSQLPTADATRLSLLQIDLNRPDMGCCHINCLPINRSSAGDVSGV